MPAEGDVAQPVEGLQGPERLSGAGAQLAEQLQRRREVGGELQRRLAVQARAGDVVLAQRRQPGELDVRLGGLHRVAGQRGQPAIGAEGPGAILGLVGGAGERAERGQMVRADAEDRVQRLDRHLRRLALGHPCRSLRRR